MPNTPTKSIATLYHDILGDEGYLYHRILSAVADFQSATNCTTAHALTQLQQCVEDMRNSYRIANNDK